MLGNSKRHNGNLPKRASKADPLELFSGVDEAGFAGAGAEPPPCEFC